MRVLGIILIVFGVLEAVFIMLPVVIVILASPSDPESIAIGGSLAALALGLPAFLMIYFGRKLYRKATPVPVSTAPVTGEQKLKAALAAPLASTPQLNPPQKRSSYSEEWSHSLKTETQHVSRRTTFTETGRRIILSGEAPPQRTEQPTAPNPAPPPPPPPVPKTVVCKGCGATKNVLTGQMATCDYCGTVLN